RTSAGFSRNTAPPSAWQTRRGGERPSGGRRTGDSCASTRAPRRLHRATGSARSPPGRSGSQTSGAPTRTSSATSTTTTGPVPFATRPRSPAWPGRLGWSPAGSPTRVRHASPLSGLQLLEALGVVVAGPLADLLHPVADPLAGPAVLHPGAVDELARVAHDRLDLPVHVGRGVDEHGRAVQPGQPDRLDPVGLQALRQELGVGSRIARVRVDSGQRGLTDREVVRVRGADG